MTSTFRARAAYDAFVQLPWKWLFATWTAFVGCQHARPATSSGDLHSADHRQIISADVVPHIAAGSGAPVADAQSGCVPVNADGFVIDGAVRSLQLAAHGTQAELVAVRNYHQAYQGQAEPRGDDHDVDGYEYRVLDVATATVPPALRDDASLPNPNRGHSDGHCGYDRDVGAPVWTAGGWSRWRVASAWGTAACEPCGGVRGRVPPTGPSLDERNADAIPSELVTARDDNMVLGAAVILSDAEQRACDTRGRVDSLIESPTGLTRTTLYQQREGEMGDPAGVPDAVSVALGTSRGAVVFRMGQRAIVYARVGRNGQREGDLQWLTAREPATNGAGPAVGAPAAAFIGDELVIVWSARIERGGPYQLHYVRWDPSSGVAPAPRVVHASTDDQLAPTLVVSTDRIALTWMEGDVGRRGVVRFATVPRETAIEHLADAIVTLSPGSIVNARDPEMAIDGSTIWIAWQEFPAPRTARVRAIAMRCHP